MFLTSGCKLLLQTQRYFSKTSYYSIKDFKVESWRLSRRPSRMVFQVCCILAFSSSQNRITSDIPCSFFIYNNCSVLWINSFYIILITYHTIMEADDTEQLKLSNKYLPNQVFRMELSPEEAKGLNMIMPRGYVLQLDPRRKDKSQPKKKTPEEILLATSQVQGKAKVALNVAPIPPPKKGAQNTNQVNEALKPCFKTLEQLKQHKCAWPFLEPVDVQALNIPQYREIIKEPMDFSTIESKLKGGKYQNNTQFHEDVLKIFNNSYIFNQGTEDFIKVTMELEKYYYRVSGETKPPPDKSLPKLTSTSSSKQQKKKKKPLSGANSSDSMPMTTQEKRQLAFNLHRLAKQHIKGVRTIVFDSNSEQNQFNLEALSQKKLRELQRYIRNKIIDMQNSMHSSIVQKSQMQSLDELESQISEEFIIEPLEKPMQMKMKEKNENLEEKQKVGNELAAENE